VQVVEEGRIKQSTRIVEEKRGRRNRKGTRELRTTH